MKYGFALAGRGPLASGEMLVRMAKKGEELGYDAVLMGDHVLVPKEISSPYPHSQWRIPRRRGRGRDGDDNPAGLYRRTDQQDPVGHQCFDCSLSTRVTRCQGVGHTGRFVWRTFGGGYRRWVDARRIRGLGSPSF